MAGPAETVLSSSFPIYAALLFIAGNAVAFIVTTLRPKSFPPGPRGLPGFGNLFQIDKRLPFLTYCEWAKGYGVETPLGIKKGATNVVVLNSERLVRDLFEKRGAVYSARPRQYMNDTWVFKGDLKTALFQHSSAWLTRWRKEFVANYGPVADSKLRPVYEAETARLLVKLVESSNASAADLETIIVTWLISAPCLGVCGRRPDQMEDHDFTVQQFRDLTERYAALLAPTPGDIFPVLRYLPAVFGVAEWKERARVVREDIFKMDDQFVSVAKDQRAAIDSGKSVPWESVASKMLKEQREKGNDYIFTLADVGHTALHVLATARATSLAVFSVMLLALVKYPEHQERIRKEVLEVSGGATPKASDIPSLKYTEAFWHEVHRWRPVAPQGVPHATAKDDVYNGHHIPAGTTMVMNVYQIYNNEDDYEEPLKFNPERYLRHPFGMRPDKGHDPAHVDISNARNNYGFGAGRRVCPGQHLAKQSLILGMAKMLWAFDISAPEGKDIDLSLETGFVQGTALGPKALDLILKLRKGRSKEDILEHYSKAYEAEAEVMGWEDGIYK